MKTLLAIAFSLSTFSAFAGESFICREINGDEYHPHKMVLTQVGSEKILEGQKHAFKLELYLDNKRIAQEAVVVETEDVMFAFSNKAKKISGMIYMDELEQSSLKIGKKKIDFDCR